MQWNMRNGKRQGVAAVELVFRRVFFGKQLFWK
jgi:hypothetical protein